jgi:hypothetical protein
MKNARYYCNLVANNMMSEGQQMAAYNNKLL